MSDTARFPPLFLSVSFFSLLFKFLLRLFPAGGVRRFIVLAFLLLFFLAVLLLARKNKK